ncbi:MAG: hypothetical protein ACTMHL_00260 [Janibacter sp.]
MTEDASDDASQADSAASQATSGSPVIPTGGVETGGGATADTGRDNTLALGLGLLGGAFALSLGAPARRRTE